MLRQLSPAEIYRLGKKHVVNTTIDSDLVPLYGEGSRIWGVLAESGQQVELIDFCSGIGVTPLGHDGKLLMIPGNEWFNNAEVQLAEKLCAITPGKHPKKVFFGNSGAESVEAAVKMCLARRYHEYMAVYGDEAEERLRGKRVFCAFGGAFHGRTGFALSLNCSKKKHTEAFFLDRGDLSVGMKVKEDRAIPVRHLPFPERNNPESIAAFKEMLKLQPFADATAMFVELIQGEGGIRVMDEDCLQLLVAECRKHDVYLVVDEVQTGMMRTGRMFACEYFRVGDGFLEPDIICLSKALGGGRAPIGATIARAEFDFPIPGEHSNTFGGNAFATEAAFNIIEQLEALNREDLTRRIVLLAEFAPEGLGLMRRIVFRTVEERNAVAERARKHPELGVSIISAGELALRCMVPVNISTKDLAKGIKILRRCMAK
ncbi:MAG: aminotransferase class III-fold pyridoxal phosphate-dependent enzyme [bacterium]|nr:aminotransferase class III-fold pyridoxal phosphate-dependent enzyme [bacterium]